MPTLRICLGRACEWRERCAEFSRNKPRHAGRVVYFQPLHVGEFCKHFQRQPDPAPTATPQ